MNKIIFCRLSTYLLLSPCLFFLFIQCNLPREKIEIDSEVYHSCVDKVTEIMIHDIFSPPVASRIYVYPNIAAYEILQQTHSTYPSLVGRVGGLKPIPTPPADVSLPVSSIVAYIEVARLMLFTEEALLNYRDSLYESWKGLNEDEFENAHAYGLEVATHIKQWMSQDMYNQTRTMPKFSVNTREPSRWQPTPPAYMDGIEPHWREIRTMCLTFAAQWKPSPPPAFSLDNQSDFYKELKEVYDISQRITAAGDESEEVKIAQFWDCNPYVSVQRGHFMFATKKITPGAHWMGIAKIATRKQSMNLIQTLRICTYTSVAIFDAFISCWDEKYRSNLIRPETLINQYIDEQWTPILQTPPFPEYSSGHSVVSGAASTMLTHLVGDHFSFDDDTEVPYGLPIRSFSSFNEAASEAAISRMYGGIHYRAAVEEGLKQGINVGKWVVQTLESTNKPVTQPTSINSFYSKKTKN